MATPKATTKETMAHERANPHVGGILDLGEMGADLEDHGEEKLNRSKPG